MKIIAWSFCFILLIHCDTFAQSRDIRMFAFGHSLLDHRPPAVPTPSDETTIMHWIAEIAAEAGHNFAGGGQYGFLTSHDDLPPIAQWGYDQVAPVWDSDTEPFSDANVNVVLITAANFIQYQPAHLPHPLDNSTTVLSSTETIFDWVAAQEPGVNFYIYGNWPEMDLMNAYPPTPPSQQEVDDYHDWTSGSFTDWWIDYQDSMLINHPVSNTRLIPVGSIISKILRDIIPGQIPFTELYEDSDPHGRANIYFLAGIITYMAVYQERIPYTYVPDTIVNAVIRNSLPSLADFIWNELTQFNLPNGESRVFSTDPITGIDNIELDTQSILLIPNPTSGQFLITGDLDNYAIDVLDSLGNTHLQIDNTSNVVPINISALPNGVYFIRVQSQNHATLSVERLLKTN